MTAKNNLLFLTIILFLMTSAVLYANPVFITSPQRESTFGRFSSSADDFLSPRSFVNVDFDNMFSVVSFSSKANRGAWNFNDMAQLGVAARFGNIYLGLYYGGNSLQNFGRSGADTNIHSYTEEKVNFFSKDRTMRIYDREPTLTTDTRYHWIYNEFGILIGIGDLMGFRFSYGSNYQSLNLTDDFVVDRGGPREFYKNFINEYGFINPEIAWALSKELVQGRGIKPELKIDLDFFRNYTKRNMYDVSGNSMGDEITRSQNYLDLGLFAGAGGFTFMQINEFKLGVDLEYLFRIRFHDNEFSYKDADGIYQIAKLNGGRIIDHATGQYSYNNNYTHTITPWVSVSWSGDRMSLSSRLVFQMRYDIAELTSMGQRNGSDPNGVLIKNMQENTTNTFTFIPSAETGMKWEVVANRFFINAGGLISFGNLNLEYKDEQNYINGNKDASRPAGKIINNSFRGASTALRLGVTFNPVKYFEIQAVCGVDSGNSINLFGSGSGGFAAFSYILGVLTF